MLQKKLCKIVAVFLLLYNVVIFYFPIWIPDCDSHSPLLGLFLSSDASVCATMAFPPLWNSDHVVVSVSIDFPSNSQRNVSFHHIVYDYFCADWDGLRDHLRRSIREFCEWVHVKIDVYILHHKYQVKSHPSPWF